MTKEAHSLANMSQQKPRERAVGPDYKAARTTGTEVKLVKEEFIAVGALCSDVGLNTLARAPGDGANMLCALS